jgi:hypothetical protein
MKAGGWYLRRVRRALLDVVLFFVYYCYHLQFLFSITMHWASFFWMSAHRNISGIGKVKLGRKARVAVTLYSNAFQKCLEGAPVCGYCRAR